MSYRHIIQYYIVSEDVVSSHYPVLHCKWRCRIIALPIIPLWVKVPYHHITKYCFVSLDAVSSHCPVLHCQWRCLIIALPSITLQWKCRIIALPRITLWVNLPYHRITQYYILSEDAVSSYYPIFHYEWRYRIIISLSIAM